MRNIAFFPILGEPIEGNLFYSVREYSSRFSVDDIKSVWQLDGDQGRGLLSLGTLQLEIDNESGRVLYVWGLHPHTRWVEGVCRPENFSRGGVMAQVAPRADPGGAARLIELGAWSTRLDRETGWVRIAGDASFARETLTLIATDTLLGITDGSLSSVWLRPQFEGEV